MEVRVTGDVVVNGTMEAALVEAGGSVTVKGGIIGMAEAMQDASGPARTAHIVCGGELKARFIENAIISAGQNVEVEREIRNAASPPAARSTWAPPTRSRPPSWAARSAPCRRCAPAPSVRPPACPRWCRRAWTTPTSSARR